MCHPCFPILIFPGWVEMWESVWYKTRKTTIVLEKNYYGVLVVSSV